MAVCPNCEYEYVEGVTFCPDCGVTLVDEKYYWKPEDWTEENWEVVYTSGQDYEVEMIKDNLEGAGIKAAILSQKDRNFPTPGDFSVVKLLVKKQDVASALNFIQKIKSESSSEEDED
ncbi:MAG: zinc ribbon domain-containing protein [Ignavibacteriaceae bacterium]